MDSLETLKQEILKQKTALASKGVTIIPANTNPSPSEITAGINSIVYANLSQATATENDVASGKTFYAGNNTLKTGTKPSSGDASLATFVCGVGSHEITIPTESTCTFIRDYCYTLVATHFTDGCFYKHNLTIPSNIEHIGGYSFNYTPITGKLTINSGCEISGLCSFRGSEISEVDFGGTFESVASAGYCFSECPNLNKVTLNEGVNIIPNYTFQKNPLLKSVVIPASVTQFGNSVFKSSPLMEYVKFQSSTPPTLASNTFNDATSICLLIPHEHYYSYWSATNYQTGNPLIGYKTFNAGDSLPSSDTHFTITWHTTFSDAKNKTNPVTSTSGTAELYGAYTQI